MLPIDAGVMRAIAPRVRGRRASNQSSIIEDAGKDLANMLDKYEINTPLRVAHFLAQTCHESDGFSTTMEYASGAAYEGRRDLGNTQPGDGRKFKGRGLIQLTGRANYAAAGARLKLDLIDNPDLAAAPMTSVLIACDFWQVRNINPHCDRDDINKVTKIINGGLNGIESRRAYLAKAKTALAKLQAGQLPAGAGALPTLRPGMEGDDVTRLQEALRQKGISVPIEAVFGPGTETAVRQFQLSNKLTVDGIVGPATWKALL
ncbi:MAG: peptidoglycan-binding protein [Methylocella sp.]